MWTNTFPFSTDLKTRHLRPLPGARQNESNICIQQMLCILKVDKHGGAGVKMLRVYNPGETA